MSKFCLPFLSSLLFSVVTLAQTDIPLGAWRMHLSYGTISAVAIGSDEVFGASLNSVMALEKSDNSINVFSKLNGLTATGITFINYNQQTDQLLIAYEDGNLDIVNKKNVVNFDRLKTATAIAGSKKINHIAFQSSFAYLASDYGLVVFDLTSNEVKETWRDLGVGGAKLKILQSTFLGDSIFLATEKGILAGNLNDNLLDYNNWKRFDQGSFSGPIQSVAAFNGKVYAAVNNLGLYRYENGVWQQETFLQGLTFKWVNASDNHLLITTGNALWRLDKTNTIVEISDTAITNPLFASEDASGNLWIGDAKNGLISNVSGSFISYQPNGPSNGSSEKLKYYNNTIYSLPGGFSDTFQALNNPGGFDTYHNGLWTNQPSTILDVTDIDFAFNQIYVSSFGYGVEEFDSQNNLQLFNESNSPLTNVNPPGRFVNITALESSQAGIWVANYGAINSLQLLKSDNTWESFSFSTTPSRFPTDLLVDLAENIWIILNPVQGGGLIVFDREKNKKIYLSDQLGKGGLPSIAVRSIALDRDGYVWVGTDAGVAFFIDDVFASSVDAVKPIFENRFLLKSEKITAIKVDGGNRKWIGTENGVWLFDPTGENLIYNFTTANSPLISNVIRDIEINPVSGEVFFATDKGIISYRGDATGSTTAFQRVKIFPNPVTSEFSGTIGITGLATDAVVKITDISGALIWQTQAAGGTATWNMRDYNGHKAKAGIYVVFAATQDAADGVVGKIAIIE